MDERCEGEWQGEREKNHEKVRSAVRMEQWSGIHRSEPD